MCSEEAFNILNRISETIRKAEPISTWRPWNPVAIKKVEPYALSAIENGASVYSNPWHIVNTRPRVIVRVNPIFDFLEFPFSISWWAHVTDIPEESRRIVLSSGILIGLNEETERGGQLCPSSGVGEILLWKNAQKNDTKNRTSDRINRIIPVFSPFITSFEWLPWEVASRWISRHHAKAIRSIAPSLIVTKDSLILLIQIRVDVTKHRAPFDARIGQGLFFY